MRPDETIAGIVRAHAAFDRSLGRLTEADVRAPSLLPGWSRAHVLAHVARNADSVVRRLQGAIDDEVVEQYVGGAAGREAGIEESARHHLDALTADVRSSSAETERLIAAMPDDAWDRKSRAVSGALLTADEVVYSRWREVEIHHVDLDLDYSAADWPDALVARMLPELLEQLPSRAPAADLLAWAIGRGPAPQLRSWG